MRRLALITATALLAFLLLVPPAWAEWVWPIRGEVITPYRNGEDPYASGQHRGIDIAGDVGAAVVAAAAGEVRFAGTAGSSGLTVSVRTSDGRFDTSYLHLSSMVVREGDRVAAGTRLGAVGTGGVRSAAAPHLHFGVRDAGSRHAYHDPLGFLPPSAGPPAPREAPAPNPSPVPVAPAPAPVRAPAGRRIPVRAPAPRRVPVGAPSPRRVPVGAPSPRRVPVGAPGPRAVPIEAPRTRGLRAETPGPHGALAVEPSPSQVAVGPNHRGSPSHRGSPGHGGSPSHGSPGHTGSPRHHAGPAPSGRRSVIASSGADPDGRASPRHTLPGNALPRRALATQASPGDASPSGAGPATGDAAKERSRSGPDLGLVFACVGLVLAAVLLGMTDDGRKATRKTGHRIGRLLQPVLGRR